MGANRRNGLGSLSYPESLSAFYFELPAAFRFRARWLARGEREPIKGLGQAFFLRRPPFFLPPFFLPAFFLPAFFFAAIRTLLWS